MDTIHSCHFIPVDTMVTLCLWTHHTCALLDVGATYLNHMIHAHLPHIMFISYNLRIHHACQQLSRATSWSSHIVNLWKCQAHDASHHTCFLSRLWSQDTHVTSYLRTKLSKVTSTIYTIVESFTNKLVMFLFWQYNVLICVPILCLCCPCET